MSFPSALHNSEQWMGSPGTTTLWQFSCLVCSCFSPSAKSTSQGHSTDSHCSYTCCSCPLQCSCSSYPCRGLRCDSRLVYRIVQYRVWIGFWCSWTTFSTLLPHTRSHWKPYCISPFPPLSNWRWSFFMISAEEKTVICRKGYSYWWIVKDSLHYFGICRWSSSLSSFSILIPKSTLTPLINQWTIIVSLLSCLVDWYCYILG